MAAAPTAQPTAAGATAGDTAGDEALAKKLASDAAFAAAMANTGRGRRRTSRVSRSRFVDVDGFAVLRENNYTLEQGITTFSGGFDRSAKIKNPRSAFTFYCKRHMKEIQEYLKATFSDANPLSSLSERWKILDDAGKALYVEEARVDRDRYVSYQKRSF